ncbi:MAG: lysine transporter LysE [Marinosulfonomonas sp.]|nr:MAG: lysine transporter LysE [Marinosulfonomonas sp.]
MTITIYQLLLYAGALAILFLTPGPVWIAIVARTLTGGYRAAWPLALGVAIGDIVWPLLAILGITWILSVFTGFMTFLRFVASIIFIVMGVLIIRNADKKITTDTRLTRPGMWAGFAAGVAVILSSPKAILFYMGVLPGFFDLTKLTWPDISAILALSMIVPFLGNVALALLVERVRVLMTSPKALRRISLSAGVMLICVGLVIPFI